jgi:(p)ppGpp synthase/HD superfamily hydrolase
VWDTCSFSKIASEASKTFTILTLRTTNPVADKFYRKNGFIKNENSYHSSTHYLYLLKGAKKMNLIEKARSLAMKAHSGQTRKLSPIPYFSHTEGVAQILCEAGLAPEVIAAGYLHDTVEDTDVTIEEIGIKFGPQVANLVAGNTEDKTKSWEERKAHTIQELKTASFEVKCLVAADKLDNLRSLIEESKNSSKDMWSLFARGKDKQSWYYKGIANALFENVNVDDIPHFFHLYKELVYDFFQ